MSVEGQRFAYISVVPLTEGSQGCVIVNFDLEPNINSSKGSYVVAVQLVGWWKLNDNSNIIVDSIYANNGLAQNNPMWVDGPVI